MEDNEKKMPWVKVLLTGFLVFVIVFLAIGIWKIDQPQTLGIIERSGSRNQGLDLGEAIWGNISDGGDEAEVILNSPADNYLSFSKTIGFNCSANITIAAGAFLTNISLWHNGTGTWERNTTLDFAIGSSITIEQTTSDTENNFGENNWAAQGFNSTEAITITSINVSVFDAGSCGIGTVALFATDGNRDPTGLPLTLKTFTCTGLLTGESVDVDVPDFTIDAGTNYAIVVNSTGAGGRWRHINTDNYADGNSSSSSDSGSSYTTFAGDFVFNIFNTGAGNTYLNVSINKTIDDTTLWTCEACDSDGDCGFAEHNRTVLIDTIPPSITINLPTTLLDYGYINKSEDLNWTITDTNLDSLWFNYNGTNISIFGSINSTTFNITRATAQNLTLYANDSIGNTNSSFIEWEYRLFQTGETFTTPTTSGAINPFILNITTNGTPITIVYLNYNGTNSLASISSSGNNFTLIKNQIAPGVSTITNISFFWNITQSDGFSLLTTSQNQSVSPIVINDTCSGMNVIFNFTMFDEITKAKINGTAENTSIKMDLNLYTSNRVEKLVDFFNEFNKTNPAAVCIDTDLSGGEQYSLDLQVQYSGLNYSAEFYNIERYVLNSTTLYQNISLYDLDKTNTQAFRLRVRDTSFLPIDGALIQIERKYIENGTFFITEIPKTDEGGISSASLQTNDVIYNFKIFDAGVLISTFNNVLAICQTPLVSTCEIDFNAFQSQITIPDFEEGDDFNFTLDYNDSSKIIRSQFVIPSGEPSTVKLVVIREDSLGTAICSDTLTSASGTLSCVIPNSFGNSTVLAKLFKDGVEQGKGNIKQGQKSEDIFPGILILLSVLVMITLIGMGVSDNPVVTAIFLFVGVVVLFGINLIQNTGFIGATATILFFLIAIILVIIKAARRS